MFAGSGKKLGSLCSQLQRQGNSKRASVDESSPGVCPQKNKMTKWSCCRSRRVESGREGGREGGNAPSVLGWACLERRLCIALRGACLRLGSVAFILLSRRNSCRSLALAALALGRARAGSLALALALALGRATARPCARARVRRRVSGSPTRSPVAAASVVGRGSGGALRSGGRTPCTGRVGPSHRPLQAAQARGCGREFQPAAAEGQEKMRGRLARAADRSTGPLNTPFPLDRTL
mgnify:CR=1 FL=1|jgi:hypothetical protein